MTDAASVPSDTPDGSVAVRLEGVVKRFGPVTAVDGIKLDVREVPCGYDGCERNDLDVDLIAGPGSILRTNRSEVASVLRAHGVRFGLENHPERTPSEVLEAIGDEDALGVAVDTGWWATQGCDPVAAIHELSDRLFHVHLKDVEEPGTHVTCMHGDGCARISDCVGALIDIGYAGPVSIEHHSFDRDPTPECARALTMVREQLAIHV